MSDIEKDLEEFNDDLLRKWSPEQILEFLKNRAIRTQKLSEGQRKRYTDAMGDSVDVDVDIVSGALIDRMMSAHSALGLTIVVGRGSETKPVVAVRSDVAEKEASNIEAQRVFAHELTHAKQAKEGIHARSEHFAFDHSEDEREAYSAEDRFQQAVEQRVTKSNLHVPVNDEEVADELVKAYTRYLALKISATNQF